MLETRDYGSTAYMLYCFDARGHRMPAEPIVAADDAIALDLNLVQRQHRYELWHGKRLVYATPAIAASYGA